jgi:hypothetical protein
MERSWSQFRFLVGIMLVAAGVLIVWGLVDLALRA